MTRDIYQNIRSAIFAKRPLSTVLEDGELAVGYHTDEVGVYLRDTAGKVRKIGPAYVGPLPPNPAAVAGGYNTLSDGELWVDTSDTTAVVKYYDENLDEWIGTGILDSSLPANHIIVGDATNSADKYNLDPDSFFIDNTPGSLEVRIASSPVFGSFGFISETGTGARSKVFSHTIPSASAGWVEIESFDKSLYSSAKYLVQLSVGSQVCVTELLLAHNGTDAYYTEYGTVVTGVSASPLGSFRALIANVGGTDVVSLEFQRSAGLVGDILIRSLQTSLI